MDEQTRTYFKENNGILTTSQLKKKGLNYSKIQSLLKDNSIIQLRRGYYRLIDDNIYSDIPILSALFPDAILCLESAINHYGYIDRIPSFWHVAVKSSSARVRFNINCIQIKPHFVISSKYTIGVTDAKIDGFKIKIYDRERTICDVLSHKNKLDGESYSQAIQGYLHDDDINIPTLMRYAKQLHVEKKVREVLLPWI